MSILDGTIHARTLPDWAQLGERLFICDGVNPNLVVDGPGMDPRPMGCMPQWTAPTLTLKDATAGLTPGAVYTYGVRRLLRCGALEIPSAVTTNTVTVGKHQLVCGTAGQTNPATWAAVTDGEFALTVAGVAYDVTAINFSGAATMAAVAAKIQTALRALTSGQETVEWATNHFLIESAAGVVSVLAAVSGGTGTDIAAAGWMNGKTGAGGGTSVSQMHCDVQLVEQEYQPPAGAAWTVHYQVLRSQAGGATTLYGLDELTQAEFENLTTGVYHDEAADSALNESLSVDLTATDENGWVPPVRYVRAFQGRLIMGGSYAYSEGTVAGTQGASTLTVTDGEVQPCDVGAYLAVDGEPALFLVTAVDVATKTYTLDKPLTDTWTAAQWRRFRDFDTVYVTNPLPGNIESYTVGTELYSNAGANNRIQGIAVNGSWCYILRRTNVELLDGSQGEFALTPHPAGPPGTVSHATLADRYSAHCLYYAGEGGFWLLAGNEARRVGDAVQGLLETEVDHGLDPFTHAVEDPGTGLYWCWLFGRDWREAGIRVPQLLLIYDTRLDQWYGPGELAASASGIWKSVDSRLVPVIGIAGGVAQLGVGSVDGADHGGTVGAATSTTLQDPRAAFPTAGLGLAGCPVHVYASDGTRQRRIVRENTGDTLTIFGEWSTTPVAGAEYRVGAIRWLLETGEVGFANRFETVKQVNSLAVALEPPARPGPVTVTVRGVRSFSSRGVATEFAGLGRDLLTLTGSQLGTRTRQAVVTLAGETAPAAVLGLKVDSEDARR